MTKSTPANRRETGLIEAGRATRFRKGQSGNPSGRPSTKPLSDELRKRLAMRLPAATAKKLKLRSTATFAEAVAKALVDEALDGNTIAAREIMDRVQGRVPQAVQVDAAFDGRTQISLKDDDAVVAKLLGDSTAPRGTGPE